MKPTILVTGANGYLASYVYKENKDRYHWIRMTRKDADFSHPDQVASFLKNQDFDICYHTAANANTAWCLANPDLAYKINVESTKEIIEACKEKKARLIFSGTEQSFNGKETQGPFSEDETPLSVTVYGQNKSECEEWIHKELDDAIILRYSWMMGLSFDEVKASPSLIKNVMNALIQNKATKFTCNEKRGLTYAKHLAKQFEKIVSLEAGTYHVAASNTHTTYESACIIAQKLGVSQDRIDQLILPDTQRYADRFRDYRLDASKLEKKGICFGTFEDNVDELLEDFQWK